MDLETQTETPTVLVLTYHSEAYVERLAHTGLVPRFVTDLPELLEGFRERRAVYWAYS